MSRSLSIFLGVLCVLAVHAGAQESTSATAAPKAGVAPQPKTQEQAAAVMQYWTAERLAKAVPLRIPEATPLSSVSATQLKAEPLHQGGGGLPDTQAMSAPTLNKGRFPLTTDDGGPATAAPQGFSYEMPFDNYRMPNPAYPFTAMGKLFFHIPAGRSQPAGDYVCSAAAAGTKSYVLVTARHCVFDIGTGLFYQNWVFYPGWQNGSNASLGGAWTPEVVATWVSQNTRSLTTGWDIAMMAMHDHGGRGCHGNVSRTLGSYTGWLGYSYGGDFSQRQWSIFGYPQGSPFEGNWLYQDNGATGIVNPLGSNNVVEVGNPQTGGTSGGPWVIGLDPSNRPTPFPNNNTNPGLVNLANGVNSFIWTNPSQPLAINGTIFQQSNYWNLLTFLLNQPCS